MAMRAPSSRRWGLLCLAMVLAAVAAPSFVLGTSSAPVPERTTHIGAAAFKGESEPQFHEQKPTGAGAVASFASAFLALVLFGSAAQAWTHTGIADWPAEFPMCSEKSQSPIDLSSSVSGKGDTLAAHVKYEPMSERSIKHNGHVMQVDGGFGTFKLPDGDYQVKQFHFHFPAEHSVDGKLAAGEMHIVHQKVGSSGTNDLAVIGIMLEESKSSAPESKFLQTLFKNAPAEGTASEVGNVDLNVFNNEFKDFYHYKGSLTTPPCAEGVHWYVAKKTAPVSSETVQAFKAKFKEDDNRPVQPLNGRELVLDKLALDKEFA